MHRRILLRSAGLVAASAVLPARFAAAHHGWSSFDGNRPLYLEGRVSSVSWANPHASFEIEPPADLKLPSDLARRSVPPQQASVDVPAVLAKTQLPTRRGERWTVELAPLFRMEAWRIRPLKVGDSVSLVGYAAPGEQGPAVVRAEFLFVDNQAYGLRSGPA
jgi:hypothetical protein